MSGLIPSDAKQLKCPCCGAPVTSIPGRTTIRCEYCGGTILVHSESRPSPPPTIIIETRRRHIRRHHLRRLMESAESVLGEANVRVEDENPER